MEAGGLARRGVSEGHARIEDPQELWERAYRERPADEEPAPSAFAREVVALLPSGARVLELGCGLGADAALFARAGHEVVASDIAAAALARLRAQFVREPRLAVACLDLRAPLPFTDAAFDAVYGRLSLHYFDDATTRAVFAEIARVLRPGGVFAFMCKSTADLLHGRGELVEPDMFALAGKVRHFFSEAYTRACLDRRFQVDWLTHGFEPLPGEPSHVVRVLARRAPGRTSPSLRTVV